MHSIIKCRQCKTIIAQCRCHSPETPIEWQLCADCAKPTLTNVPTQSDDAIVLDHMARVGYERMFEERWTSLVPGSIERALWIAIATAMLREARRWRQETPTND